jgi:hypothetical protein
MVFNEGEAAVNRKRHGGFLQQSILEWLKNDSRVSNSIFVIAYLPFFASSPKENGTRYKCNKSVPGTIFLPMGLEFHQAVCMVI